MLRGLNHITLSVSDVERSFEFYTTVFGFEAVARWPKGHICRWVVSGLP
jgi:glutathione S-transferase fosA5